MKDILLLYDGEDAERWVGYINDMLCKNELALSVECKDLRTDQEEVLRECENFLVVSVLVSPAMLETLSSASDRLAPVIQKHACVSVILLYTDPSELRNQLQNTYNTLGKWKQFDITNKPDSENKKTVSEIIDLLEKEREHHNTLLEAASAKKERKTSTEAKTSVTELTHDESVVKPKPAGVEEKPKQTKRGTRHARSILETVCPKKISKSGEEVVMILKQSLEGVVQVEFKKTDTKIDTKKINPYCYSFISPDLRFGRHQFYVYVDGKKQSLSSLQYIAPTQMAYECPAFLCQALDITPGDMAGLDRRLTGIFRTSLPNDEGLSRILSPATLAAEAAASKVDHHFPTLLHFAAFHGLRDLCNALLDMPGAIAAFHKTNIDDKDPLDLAEDAQHDDLADFFRDYLEMQETITTYQQFYVHMYDKQGKRIATGQPGYLEMIGHGPDHVEAVDYDNEEDEYEIKRSTLESGVIEVLPDEDIVEEPKPGLPPRKPKPPATLSKPSSKIDIASAPPVTPRKPRTDPDTLPQESPEQFMGMVGDSSPLRPVGTGSGTLNELVEIQEAFKRKEIDERDVDMLYTSWTERYKEGKASASMKERQKQLSEMKEKYQALIKTAEKKEKRGFFERLTMKKKPTKPAIAIQHIPSSNPYTSWSQVPSGFAPVSERDARMSTISNSSTSSSSSYASSTSRDSAMSIQSLQNIPESDSDLDELGEAPPVPTRKRSTDRQKDDRRKSLGEQFLMSVQNKPNSRLPQPPPQHYKSRTLPAKAPAQRTASSPSSQSPAVPPRKISH